MIWFIYGLCDPTTGEVRYVGKSNNPARRLLEHAAPGGTRPVNIWIAGLGKQPTVKVFTARDTEQEAAAEELNIIRALSIGGRLLNKAAAKNPTTGDIERFGRVEFLGMGERLKAKRKERGLTMCDLERATGVTQPTISYIESGRNKTIMADSAVLIARALGTTVEYLVTGESS